MLSATAANGFFVVVASSSLGRNVQIGERSPRGFMRGRACVENGRTLRP